MIRNVPRLAALFLLMSSMAIGCQPTDPGSASTSSALLDPCQLPDGALPLRILALEPASYQASSGSPLAYRLRFERVGAALSDDYVPFVHFVRESDETWFAFQEFPIAAPPSSTWSGTTTIEQTTTLPATASGRYAIRAGLARRTTGENVRLVAGPGSQETFTAGAIGWRYTLGTVEVGPPPAPGADLYKTQTLIDDMTIPNDRGWWLATNGDLTADRNGPDRGAGRTYAYVSLGIRQADKTSYWPGSYIDSSFGLSGDAPVNRLGWFVVMRAAQSSTRAPNTRTQTRNFKNLILRRDGTWVDGGSSSISADPYPAAWYGHFSSPGNEPTESLVTGSGVDHARNETSGGASVGSIGAGTRDRWALHAWPAGQVRPQREWVNDVTGVLTVFEARLIVHDQNGRDDRADANLMVWTGADWYEGNRYLGEHSHGRLKLLTNDWQIFSTTDISADELRLHPPPGYSN